MCYLRRTSSQWLNCEKRTGGTLEARRRDERRRCENRGAEGREMGRGCPLPNRLGGLGERRELPSEVQGGAPAENEFGAFCGRSKDADSNYLLNFCFIKHCSLAFRLERLHKFRYGVPPFQKVPVWRSGAFRLSLSTASSPPTVFTALPVRPTKQLY